MSGAIQPLCTSYAALQVKQVQYDTLTHLFQSRISTLTIDNSVSRDLTIPQYLYRNNEEETPSQIFLAFHEGTYHNVLDFWNFLLQIRNSISKWTYSRELAFMGRLQSDLIEEVQEDIPGNHTRCNDLLLDTLCDQRDLTVMMDCEFPGNPIPEEFTRFGPLPKSTATKFWAYAQKLLYQLDNNSILHTSDAPLKAMEAFETMGSSNEIWEELKEESTLAEFQTMRVIWDVYQCRKDLLQDKFERLQKLVILLGEIFPLYRGEASNDAPCEIIHASFLTVRVSLM